MVVRVGEQIILRLHFVQEGFVNLPSLDLVVEGGEAERMRLQALQGIGHMGAAFEDERPVA